MELDSKYYEHGDRYVHQATYRTRGDTDCRAQACASADLSAAGG